MIVPLLPIWHSKQYDDNDVVALQLWVSWLMTNGWTNATSDHIRIMTVWNCNIFSFNELDLNFKI